MSNNLELVRLKNGIFSIRSLADGETFHPIAGPVAEAEGLYVRQLLTGAHCSTEVDDHPLTIWDVGLGAGGNALTAIRFLARQMRPVRIVSFDRTLEPLRFALMHASELEFPLGFEEPIRDVIEDGRAEFVCGNCRVEWQLHTGDFPHLLASSEVLPAPHAIFFDAYSPAKNPEMWTVGLFEAVFRRLDRQQPCALATYSRSTMARTAMLLAGFFVGFGDEVSGKEETTIAANTLALLRRPLNQRWIDRVRVSDSAEPLWSPDYARVPLAPTTWEKLCAHPQFARCSMRNPD